MKLIRKTILAVALGAATLTAASPAMADDGRYRHRGGGDTTGAAIAGGVVGLALGAAIASSANDRRYDRDYYYDDRDYYYDRGYPRARAYYYYDRYPRAYYRPNYYYRGGWRGDGWRGHEWREHRGWHRDNGRRGHDGWRGDRGGRGW